MLNEVIREEEQAGLLRGREKGLEEGRKEGLKDGIIEGVLEGVERGRKQGLEEGRIQALKECILLTLKSHFGKWLDRDVESDIRELTDLDALRSLHHDAFFTSSMDDFRGSLKETILRQSIANEIEEMVEDDD